MSADSVAFCTLCQTGAEKLAVSMLTVVFFSSWKKSRKLQETVVWEGVKLPLSICVEEGIQKNPWQLIIYNII